MKRFSLLPYALVFGLCVVLVAACDSGFEEMNTDPTQASAIDLGFQFTDAQLQTSGERYENWRGNLIYSSTMVQHFATLPTFWAGDKYLYIASYSAALFERAYPGSVKEIVDLINKTAENPADVNRHSAARIWRVVVFQRLTDLYGDIPYFEAGKGFIENISTPAYDPQQEIYMDMLNELKEAVAAFDDSQPTFGNADLLYGGDIEQWKRFGNSMMLRLAMRLSKVEPSTAEQWVQEAVAGGVMQSNADLAAIPHTDGPAGINKNGNGEVFEVDGSPRLSDTFVSWMKERDDPRLGVYGAVIDESGDVITDPAVQKGLPNGFDATTIESYPGGSDLSTYTQPHPVITGVDDPMFIQTYAEVELMLAEAAVRGWISDDPAAHYEAGVRAAMDYLALYGDAAVISGSAIDAYLAANPFASGSMEAQLEQINEQYWAAVLLNEYEAFANWRRSGYPELDPVDYPGNVTNGTIPRRLQYPGSERTQNAASYNAAIERQGPDVLTTRVWWDVPQ